MGSLYRSEVMEYFQLYLQADAAFACVSELGELGLCEFKDMNPDANSFQRRFVNEVKRTENMDRILRFIEEELKNSDMDIIDSDVSIPAPLPREMSTLEARLENYEEEINGINASLNQLKKTYTEQNELRQCLKKVQTLLDGGQRNQALQSISEAQGHSVQLGNGVSKEHHEKRDESELKFMAGIIKRSAVVAFERVLWRMCKGNVYMRALDIEDDPTDLFHDSVGKSAFVLFFSGEQLRKIVQKICDGFRARICPCPERATERAELLISVAGRLEDMKNVILKTQDMHFKKLMEASQNHKEWSIQVLKLKAIFHTLNFFNVDVTQKCLIGECWIPHADVHRVQEALRRGSEISQTSVPSILQRMETCAMPPTFNRTNKFTRGFQNIVDSYGIANYREVNPAPWTIITFPFLFAVMFGDAGHGIIMLLAALSFVVFEKKLEALKIKDEIFQTFFGGRYVVLLMGCFSIYTGLVYNDFYSKSINIFGSSWKNPYNTSKLYEMMKLEEQGTNTLYLELLPEYAYDRNNGPYPFGLDPVWNVANNKLNFMNPMKMKSSIILGISQMVFGVFLSLMNHVHFRSPIDIIFVFIPQLLFLCCIFVYLCLQVIIKWIFFHSLLPEESTTTYVFGQQYPGTHCAPSLLIGLINMLMFKSRHAGFINPVPHGSDMEACYLQLWYPNQDIVEKVLVVVAVICIPIMLFVKPFYQRFQASRGHHVGGHGHGGGDGEDEEFNFGDAFVYQAIHTIEFALGCISHTASYLRLWALSLAHARKLFFWTCKWITIGKLIVVAYGNGGAKKMSFVVLRA
uniref:V-type proton ATPase subunit a n=1 Tax=Steinernema glaseri TaxID=37863 RepID=A0A1I8APV2_9BILA